MSAFLDNVAVEHKENFGSVAKIALMDCIVQEGGPTTFLNKESHRCLLMLNL